ncbi:MAG: DsbA family protein, partial [Pseudomonadota bacterium]
YKPLDIITLFSRTGGTAPKDRHPARQDYRAQELVRQAAALGMPFNLKPAHWPTNPAPSSYAFIAAAKEGGDLGALVAAFTRACWADEKDIAQDDVIRDCLSGAGFDPSLADRGLLAGAETYAQNLEDAVNAGAFGAPFYITDDGARFWGQDRIADLDRHLSR